MQVHIGNLIRDEVRRQGRTNAWLAEKIGVTTRTLQRIYNHSSIDTQQLLLICRVLNKDFFEYYSSMTHIVT